MRGKKFKLPAAAAREVVSEITSLAGIFAPVEKISLLEEDPADNRILECALAAGADVIVSGDKHLLALKTFRDMPILSPAECLEKFEL